MPMTCAEVERVVEAFVDGELPGRTLRDVARHLASCPACETTTVRFERVQEAVRETVLSQVGERDAGMAWRAIAGRLPSSGPPARRWWRDLRESFRIPRLPAPVWVGSAAVLVTLALLWVSFWRPPMDVHDDSRLLAQQSRIDLLETPGSVRVWNQQESGALVIWVDEEGLNVEPLDP